MRDILGSPHHVSEQWVGGGREQKGSRYHSLSLSLTHRIFENLWPPVTFPDFLKKHQGFEMIFWQENANENWCCETQDHTERDKRGRRKKSPDWGPNYSTTDSMTGRIQCPVALLILLSCQASGTFHDSWITTCLVRFAMSFVLCYA